MTELFTTMIGWLGSAALAACGIPLLYAAIKERSIAKNLNGWFLFLWIFGECLTLCYAAMIGSAGLPLILNYSINLSCLAGILWLRWSNE